MKVRLDPLPRPSLVTDWDERGSKTLGFDKMLGVVS